VAHNGNGLVAVGLCGLLCGFERSEKSQSKTTQTTDNQPNDMCILIQAVTFIHHL